MIKLTVLTTPGCQHCKAFKEFWHSVEKDWPEVEYKELDITSSLEAQALVKKHMVFSSPGIIINEELLASGGFSEDQFLKKLDEAKANA
jgi:glutaredoxin